jgi:FkbM family methyltransferase
MGRRAVDALLNTGSRLKRRIHEATVPRSLAAKTAAGVNGSNDVDAMLRLLFPHGATPTARDVVRTAMQAGPVSASTVRRILGGVDLQTSPSPFSVRLSAGDLAYVAIDGVEVALDTADQSVSGPIIATGTWEPHVAGVIRKFLAPGSVFVDIGANVGWHTALASRVVGAAGEVFAFEPNPDNARLIAHTIEHNGLTNVRLFPLALADSVGFAAFRSAIGSNGGFLGRGESGSIDPSVTIVPTMRLDDIGLTRIDVIKIDVEGAEPIVFRGGLEALGQLQPVVVFEFSCEMTERVGGVAARDHLTMFESFGYELFLIERITGALAPIGGVDQLLDSWGDRGRIEDLVAVPRRRSSEA